MYYNDFDKIEIDEFVGTRFGKENQLEVIGWSGRIYYKNKSRKAYIVKCNICANDSELFGDGLFSCPKNNLVGGQVPCGCSARPLWTKEQLEIRLSRKALGQNYKFISLLEPYTKATTKIEVSCPVHGSWLNMNANAFLSGQGCPNCAKERRVKKLAIHNSFDDEEFIEAFLSTGSYHPDTIFERSERKQPNGKSNYWKYTCLYCNSTCEALGSSLKKGQKGCECSSYNPKQAYIRILKDGDIPIALKYGIANLTQNRWYKECKLDVEEHSNWIFDERSQCIAAERFCDNNLETRVVDKQLMPDGYTETTYIKNIDKIIAIYKSFGGKQLEV